jgi:hypothetical protein
VARCASEKIAQNVARPIFWVKFYYVTLAMGKRSPKYFGYFYNKNYLKHVNTHPKGEKSPNLVTLLVASERRPNVTGFFRVRRRCLENPFE